VAAIAWASATVEVRPLLLLMLFMRPLLLLLLQLLIQTTTPPKSLKALRFNANGGGVFPNYASNV